VLWLGWWLLVLVLVLVLVMLLLRRLLCGFSTCHQ